MRFQERHGAQHCLIALLEKWRESIDRGLEFSKAFDCLPQDLFVAKLLAYGFDDKALRFIYDYLRHCKQRTKIADSYSSWQEILYGVSQGSILGSFLLPYVSGRNIEEVVASLEEVSEVIFQWFRDNQFQGNASKCHVLLSTDKQVHVNIGTAQIEKIRKMKNC